jgi:hypothetical protein
VSNGVGMNEDAMQARVDARRRQREELAKMRSSVSPDKADANSDDTALPPGWHAAMDNEQGAVYYYSDSGESSWTRPVVSAPDINGLSPPPPPPPPPPPRSCHILLLRLAGVVKFGDCDVTVLIPPTYEYLRTHARTRT